MRYSFLVRYGVRPDPIGSRATAELIQNHLRTRPPVDCFSVEVTSVGVTGAGWVVEGAKACPVCFHAAHPEKVCGLRPDRDGPACLCTAMDSVAKPARRWLTWDNTFSKAPPLQIVVWWVEFAFECFGLGMLLKMLLS